MLPTFTTPRLTLRPATMADHLDALWAHWADPDVRRYLFDDVPVTRERAAEALGRGVATADEGLGLWVLGLGGEAPVVGCAGLTRTSLSIAAFDRKLAGAVEVIVSLEPALWGRGYAQEAVARLIRYGFDEKGLEELVAVNDVPNAASDRLLRRLGFTSTGECDGPAWRMRTYVLRREQRGAESVSAP